MPEAIIWFTATEFTIFDAYQARLTGVDDAAGCTVDAKVVDDVLGVFNSADAFVIVDKG